MVDAAPARTAQRVAAIALLLVAGVISLPLSALVLDGDGTENLIVPAQLAGMALVGALVGARLPGLAGADAGRRRSAWTGAAVGVAMALLAVAFYFVVISGIGG